MVKLQAKVSEKYVCLSKDSFKYLLNCLDKQKHIHACSTDTSVDDYIDIQNQNSIDEFKTRCKELL